MAVWPLLLRYTLVLCSYHAYAAATMLRFAVVGDHIAYRYEVQEVLGRGSFGQVRWAVPSSCYW